MSQSSSVKKLNSRKRCVLIDRNISIIKDLDGQKIEIAIGKYHRDNLEDKHIRNAKYGWYRYDSRFALPVYNENSEIERYNVFHASMLIRHAQDGKLYLYDILDVKKETSNLFKL